MVHGQDLLNCFYFNDYRVVHEQIETVSIIEMEVIIEDRYDLLGHDAQAGI